VATFTGVTISAAGAAGYTLVASATGYTNDNSNPFTVTVPSFTLTVAKSGAGTVTSNTGGISCGASCSAQFTSGTTVQLTAAPSTGSSFGSWTGCNSVVGNVCTVVVDAAKSVTATFILNPNITTATLPAATAGTAYSQTLAVAGGVAPFTWSLVAGDTLPAGLGLSPAGVISGTPTEGGRADFTVRVSDAGGRTDTQALRLDVAASFVGGVRELAFLVGPTNVNAGAPISPPVQVEVRDVNGSRVTTSTATVVMVFGENVGNATLTGNTAQASAGVATFSNLRISVAANGYTLRATSDGMESVTSTSFRVR
jgi:hypothetical protein